MNNYQKKGVYLLVLSLIWGSSFILIGIGFKSLKTIDKKNYKWIAVTGALGTFFPVFSFSFEVAELDSAIVSILTLKTHTIHREKG